jgi:hypothetical protein
LSLRKEFQECVDRVRDAGADGRYTLDEIGECFREGLDCIAPIFDAMDTNDPEAVASLSADVQQFAEEIVKSLPDGRWMPRHLVNAGIGMGVDWLIPAACKAGQPFHEFVQAHVLPRTVAFESTVHRFNAALGA